VSIPLYRDFKEFVEYVDSIPYSRISEVDPYPEPDE
jgi:hypothetical protein